MTSVSLSDALLTQDVIGGTAETSLFGHTEAISSQSNAYRVGQSMCLRFASLELRS